MYPRLMQIQSHGDGDGDGEEDMHVGPHHQHHQHHGGDPCLVLTADPKPRLRWTQDLHESLTLAVLPVKATPKAIMRTMNVKGLTLFHLKSHLQKYRLGKQSGKDMVEGCNDGISGSYLLESPCTDNSSTKLPASDTNEGHEIKEALRVQMEVQSELHIQVEAEKHLQIRQDAERRYMSMLERACKMLADQFIGATVIDTESQKFQGLESKAPRGPFVDPLGFYSFPSTGITGAVYAAGEELPNLHSQRADCSTESCLTSQHESPGGLTLEGSPISGGVNKRMLSLESMAAAPLMWSEATMRTQGINVAQANLHHGLTGYGM